MKYKQNGLRLLGRKNERSVPIHLAARAPLHYFCLIVAVGATKPCNRVRYYLYRPSVTTCSAMSYCTASGPKKTKKNFSRNLEAIRPFLVAIADAWGRLATEFLIACHIKNRRPHFLYLKPVFGILKSADPLSLPKKHWIDTSFDPFLF